MADTGKDKKDFVDPFAKEGPPKVTPINGQFSGGGPGEKCNYYKDEDGQWFQRCFPRKEGGMQSDVGPCYSLMLSQMSSMVRATPCDMSKIPGAKPVSDPEMSKKLDLHHAKGQPEQDKAQARYDRMQEMQRQHMAKFEQKKKKTSSTQPKPPTGDH